MDEGSKGGRNFVLGVGFVPAFMIVLMILIGCAGTTPNMAQLTTEATR
jgi:hypothetical protein